jgi:hypothetical protein
MLPNVPTHAKTIPTPIRNHSIGAKKKNITAMTQIREYRKPPMSLAIVETLFFKNFI